MTLFNLVAQTRHLFEQRRIDPSLLAHLYQRYHPLTDIKHFIAHSQVLFPKLNCGIASLYLQYLLQEGKAIRGSYKGYAHTYLRLKENTIVDITADQFGGPPVYIGSPLFSWT